MIPRGSTLPQSKLTERLVPVIRELRAAGITTRRLGRRWKSGMSVEMQKPRTAQQGMPI